jgi:hypothetical protein
LQFASRFCSVSQVQIQLLKTCLEYRTGPYRTGTGTYRDKKAAGDAPHASRTRATGEGHKRPCGWTENATRGHGARMARHFRAWGGDPHAFSAVNRTGDKKTHSEPARRRSNVSSLQVFFVGFGAALKGLDNQHMHSRTPAVSGRVLHVPKRQGYERSLLNDSGSPGG